MASAMTLGAHGIDLIGTGFTQMLANQEVPSVFMGAIEGLGFSPKIAGIMDMCFAMGAPFSVAGNFKFLKLADKSVGTAAFNGARRTA